MNNFKETMKKINEETDGHVVLNKTNPNMPKWYYSRDHDDDDGICVPRDVFMASMICKPTELSEKEATFIMEME